MGVLSRLSGQVARDNNDVRAGGAKAYFFNGGTTTPLTTYLDAAQGAAHTHPVLADSNGRWPAIFIPFITSYDERVTTSNGTELSYYTQIPNADPFEAPSGITTSSSQLLQTGDFLFSPKSGTRAGFVRANGRTIGNAVSGGTERANADTADLFAFLWDNFSNALCPVSGGRGANAASDFAFPKTITLHDLRGSSVIGLDDMGNTAAARLASAPFTTGSATTGGSTCGENTHVLGANELAVHNHGSGSYSTDLQGIHTHTGQTNLQSQNHTHDLSSGSGTGTAASDGSHAHSVGLSNNTLGGVTPAPTSGSNSQTTTYQTSTDGAHTHSVSVSLSGNTGNVSQDHNHPFTTDPSLSHSHNVTSGLSGNAGSGNPHNVVQRGLTGNWLIKL